MSIFSFSGDSGIVKGIEYLLLAGFFAAILWLVHLKPKKVKGRARRKRRRVRLKKA